MFVNSRVISKLVKGPKGGEMVLHFADGTEKIEAFLGAVPKMKQRAPFAEQLGIELNPGGEMIAYPPFMQTNVRGVFTAGVSRKVSYYFTEQPYSKITPISRF